MSVLNMKHKPDLVQTGPLNQDLLGQWSQPHTGKHALIIEDGPLNAEVMATLVGKYGMTATIVGTPRDLDQVLDLLDQLDVIFLDLEFSEHDGFETHRELKGDPRVEGVPVVAYTVHISEIERARREGFHSFLGKPLKQEKFGEQLSQILSGQPVWDA
jgi:CheY-like chemotaxis protein